MNQSNELYLATHPSRKFSLGDKVMHCGTSKSQRGRVGTIIYIMDNKIGVKWDDDLMNNYYYSFKFALSNLAVNAGFYLNDSHFKGCEYLNKYGQFRISKEDLLKGLNLKPHAEMKVLVDGARDNSNNDSYIPCDLDKAERYIALGSDGSSLADDNKTRLEHRCACKMMTNHELSYMIIEKHGSIKLKPVEVQYV